MVALGFAAYHNWFQAYRAIHAGKRLRGSNAMPEETVLSSRVAPSLAGRSLLDYLCGRFRYHDRKEWGALIREGRVTVNGDVSAPERLLERNDIVAYRAVLREPPVDAAFSILHEEESFIVAEKTGNLPSHADGNYIKNTFIYLLRRRLEESGRVERVNLVHRLDRETSGIIVASKSRDAHRALVQQFEAGTVKKEYLAVTRGEAARDRFEVSGAIIRDTGSSISIRRKVALVGTDEGHLSLTRFEVLERLRGYTLLRCIPATGRTNQIRVHLDHVGLPLAGDKLYGRSDDQFLEFVRRARAGIHEPLPWMEAPRHLLHASRLAFDHPVTGKRVSFECPAPPDMAQFIEGAR